MIQENILQSIERFIEDNRDLMVSRCKELVAIPSMTEDREQVSLALDYVLEGTNLQATFHRAIDVSRDLLASLKLLTSCKHVTHVLTSGGPGRAVDHLPLLKVMVRESQDLTVIVGSSVQEENLLPIRNEIDFYLENGNGRKSYDIHVGTGVRGGSAENPVNREEVKKLAKLYHSL